MTNGRAQSVGNRYTRDGDFSAPKGRRDAGESVLRGRCRPRYGRWTCFVDSGMNGQNPTIIGFTSDATVNDSARGVTDPTSAFFDFFCDYKKTTWAYVRRTKDRVIHNVFIIYFFFSKSFMTECVVAPQQYDVRALYPVVRALCHIKILIPYKYLPRDKYAHVLSGRKLEDGSV